MQTKEQLPLVAGLYVVATPIGNLGDITCRALDILKKADLIAAEDTRQTAQLLQHYGIKKNCLSLHAHNESQQLKTIGERIVSGLSVALVSDAGTPAISDPGALLVDFVRKQGLAVFPIPGACAAITAMSVSGRVSPQFMFYGFFPHQSSARQAALGEIASLDYPVIFYESPHRLIDTLKDCEKLLGAERQFILAKEMTKIFEQIIPGTASELIDWLIPERCRGEFVLIILPDEKKSCEPEEKFLRHMLTVLLKELPLKQAVSLAVDIAKQRKNTIYALALEIVKNKPDSQNKSD